MISLLADENVRRSIVRQIRSRVPGSTFIRVQEVGLISAPDPAILDYVEEHGLVLITHDVKTIPAYGNARLAAGLSHPGVIVAPLHLGVGTILDNIETVLIAGEPSDFRDQIMYLPI